MNVFHIPKPSPNNMTDKSYGIAKKLTRLKEMNLSYNKFNGSGPKILAKKY
jgi:hypothetical protein